VHIVNDGHRLNIDESVLIWFRQLEGSIDEIPRFQRQLECLPPKIQAKWAQTKNQLGQSTQARGLDFKLWEKDRQSSVYSVRLSRSHRVHLSYDRQIRRWSAIDVGPHKKMGHG
jgi:hypothetical protein